MGQVINNMHFEDAKSGWKRYGCTELELKGRREEGSSAAFSVRLSSFFPF
jgi:hypothetical protein